jgi:hypothetical protein
MPASWLLVAATALAQEHTANDIAGSLSTPLDRARVLTWAVRTEELCLAAPLDAGELLAGHLCAEKCAPDAYGSPYLEEDLRRCAGQTASPCYCNGYVEGDAMWEEGVDGWYCLPVADLLRACGQLEACVGVSVGTTYPRGVLLGAACADPAGDNDAWVASDEYQSRMKEVHTLTTPAPAGVRGPPGAELGPLDPVCPLGGALEVLGAGVADGLYHPDDAAQRNAAAAEFRRYDAPGVYKYRIRLDNFSCGWVVESAGTDIKPPVPMPPPKVCADDIEAANAAFGLAGDTFEMDICAAGVQWGGADAGYCRDPVFRRLCAKSCEAPCDADDDLAARRLQVRSCKELDCGAPLALQLCPESCRGSPTSRPGAVLHPSWAKVAAAMRAQTARAGGAPVRARRAQAATWSALFTTFAPDETGPCAAPEASA